VDLQLGVDESYVLSIPADGSAASLSAPTYYGALRGLETFSQLVFFNTTQHAYTLANAPWTIKDSPRFPHRGVLIDTARHFEPIGTLKRLLDSMAYAKFNTLHWHIVDTQSFPFESRIYPLLWNGAFSMEERYTQEDMAGIVEYARQRGIRVVVEFDLPGHADSWCTGYPNLCPTPTCTTVIDPTEEMIFDVAAGLLGEVTGANSTSGKALFPDAYVHLGGDEVHTDCWDASPRIQKWFQQHNMTDDSAYMYVVERVHALASGMNRKYINWEEVFNHFGSKLDRESIIEIWLDHATLGRVVDAGYQAILANEDSWYLDHLQAPWTNFYLNEPYANITNPTNQKLVLGGEVGMWGETVDTSDLFNTVWPRAAAAAERLWSAADVTDTDAALPRLHRFRCLLNQRGIDAAPVVAFDARDPPLTPGGCYIQ
jgi:hexosaminidase